jgi:hypothetical protein
MNDNELEQLVYGCLKNMNRDELQELCRALEMIFCYTYPAVYH